MPNSQNRNTNKGGSGKGHAKDVNKESNAPKPNPERSDLKRGSGGDGERENTGRTSNQGRKRASGGS
jgi:hypothetical protein